MVDGYLKDSLLMEQQEVESKIKGHRLRLEVLEQRVKDAEQELDNEEDALQMAEDTLERIQLRLSGGE